MKRVRRMNRVKPMNPQIAQISADVGKLGRGERVIRARCTQGGFQPQSKSDLKRRPSVGLKLEIQNSNFETNSKSENGNAQTRHVTPWRTLMRWAGFRSFEFSCFEFVSDFGFRVSDFSFCVRRWECP